MRSIGYGEGLLPQIPSVEVRGNAGQDLKNNEPVGRISDSVIRRYGRRGGGLRLRLNPPYGPEKNSVRAPLPVDREERVVCQIVIRPS
jgi:hypothetical protein